MEGEELGGEEYNLQEEGEEGEQEEEEEEKAALSEEEEAPAPCPLTEEVLKEGLSLLCKTGNGLAHAYVKFEAKYKDLTDISLLECFIHLRYVDLSENKLRDLSPLSNLTHLLWLKVDRNLLASACMQELPYLQVISFAHNRIKDTEGITHPRLANLSLEGNKIQTALGLSHSQLFSLQTLELRGNMLESTAGLNLPKLKNLYLVSASLETAAQSHNPKWNPVQLQAGERGGKVVVTRIAPNSAAQGDEQPDLARVPALRNTQSLLLLLEERRLLGSRSPPQEKQLTVEDPWTYMDYAQNAIRSLEGLEGLGQLTTLHLRDNKLKTLDGFCSSMKCLQYLNLRSNGISSLQEVAKLQVLPMLQTLVLLDNPCSDEPNYRLEVLVLLPRLQRLDKELVEQEERTEANEMQQKRQEEEKETEEFLQDDATE